MLSPIFETQRFSIHDGPGIRTTVFLRGCPLQCAWCQNPEGMEVVEAPHDETWAAEVMRGVCADRAYFDVSGGGVTLSGGEPLRDPWQALALLQAAHDEGLHTCVQTSGAVASSTLRAVLPLVDLFQFDLKHVDEARHREWTGVGTSRIHQNARLLVEKGAKVQFRMPVLPGLNDDSAHLEMLASFLGELGVKALRLVPYHRHYLAKYEALGRVSRVPELKAPGAADLARIGQRMNELGIQVAVDGA